MEESSSHPTWFIFKGRALLVRSEGSSLRLPRGSQDVGHPDTDSQLELKHFLFLGKHHGPSYGGKGQPAPCDSGIPHDQSCYGGLAGPDYQPPQGFEFVALRSLLSVLDEAFFQYIAWAKQRTEWDYTMQRCPRCTSPLEDMHDEYAKTCPQCDLHFYAPVSPAVIVAIFKDDRILLAHNQRFPKGRYSLIAGFVEPGENLEGCVQREIYEEVGIQVKNITYFGSQPWPFPHSLMIGFTADHAGGTVAVDNREILDAAWFSRDSLPDLPPQGAISRRIIDWFIAGHMNWSQ